MSAAITSSWLLSTSATHLAIIAVSNRYCPINCISISLFTPVIPGGIWYWCLVTFDLSCSTRHHAVHHILSIQISSVCAIYPELQFKMRSFIMRSSLYWTLGLNYSHWCWIEWPSSIVLRLSSGFRSRPKALFRSTCLKSQTLLRTCRIAHSGRPM